MHHDVKTVAKAFAIHGDYQSAERYGSGHINDTYLLTMNQAGAPVRYLLQRINHDVFTDVPRLMENISRVLGHMQARLADEAVVDATRRALTLVPTRDNELFHRDSDGLYWRSYLFVEGARSYDVVESSDLAYTAARAFGQFQRLLTDLPGDRLHETIADFHHTPKRFAAFEAVLESDPCDRARLARPEIEWLLARRDFAGSLLDLHAQGLIPERIAHNDTKLNNVLIDDATGEAICVIDLDTVMPGLALYDFGDLVRTSTSPVAEDEPDPSNVVMQMPMFRALAQGYLDAAGDFLTPGEIASLPLAGMVIALTIGMRFLTDFLQGDTYFKTQRPQQNLQRCRTQFAMVDSIDAQRKEMDSFVESYARSIGALP